jgi:hypothetical protein
MPQTPSPTPTAEQPQPFRRLVVFVPLPGTNG